MSPTAAAGLALQTAVSDHSRGDVAWVVASGAAAVAACTRQTPDLLILDLRRKGIDGIDLTRRIMLMSPCPILLVTESLRTSAGHIYEAVGLGALDAVEMPWSDRVPTAVSAAPLVAKIETIARLIAPIACARSPHGRRVDDIARPSETLVAIGASAGGPAAVSVLLSALPPDLPAAVVLVQHVGEQFMPAMAQWLDEQSPGRVLLAQSGERPARSRVSMAGVGGHLRLTEDERFVYTAEPRSCAYRPSVDVFFESVSQFWTGPVVAVLLTGMGRDGAVGLKALRDRGHHTIAQDRASCAVYGMPKAAAALDAAVEILPLSRIAARLLVKVHELSDHRVVRR